MASNEVTCGLALSLDDIERPLGLHFTKKFSLPSYVTNGDKSCKQRSSRAAYKGASQSLPPSSKWFHQKNKKWIDPELSTMKADLNTTKGLLNEKPLKEWHRHTRFRNPAAGVLGRVRAEGENPELLTQAWCKFTECIIQYRLIDVQGYTPNGKEVFHSTHLCEAPGAFITALNHYIKTQDNAHCTQDKDKKDRKKYIPLKWNWLGSTLNPYYEGNATSTMINDDRFISHTLKTAHNKSGWIFGPDTTGDMLKRSNIEGLIEVLNGREGMHLITADGSVDCQATPGDQENMVTHLHFAEIVAAVLGLREGGHFVLKMFTFFESETVCCLYLLSNLFREVDVFKPATSKEGNSEVYVICKGFSSRILSDEMKEVLLKNIENTNGNSLFARDDINRNFVRKVRDCSKYFKEIQTRVILNNIKSFALNSGKGNWRSPSYMISDYQIKELREKIADEFISKYNIQPIRNDQRIVPATTSANGYNNECKPYETRQSSMFYSATPSMNSVRHCLQLDKKCEPAATFSSRIPQDTSQLSIGERWYQIKMRVYDIRNPRTQVLERCYSRKTKASHIELQTLFGKPYCRLKSSKFCPSEMIKVLQDTCDLLDDYIQQNVVGKKRCQCFYDWPPLDDTKPSNSKRRKLEECVDYKSDASTKCVCQNSNKRKIVTNPKYFTLQEQLSELLQEKLECYGKKEKYPNNAVCNRILEEYPSISEETKIIRLKMDDLLGDLPSSYLMALHYLDTSVSAVAFKCLVKRIVDVFQDLKKKDDILLFSFPLLTRLYVGLLHVIGLGFEEVGFVRPLATEDAVLFINFDGNNVRILTALNDILNSVEKQLINEDINKKMVLEILPIAELVQEPMYSIIVDHNICAMREKSIALFQRYDNLQSDFEGSEIFD